MLTRPFLQSFASSSPSICWRTFSNLQRKLRPCNQTQPKALLLLESNGRSSSPAARKSLNADTVWPGQYNIGPLPRPRVSCLVSLFTPQCNCFAQQIIVGTADRANRHAHISIYIAFATAVGGELGICELEVGDLSSSSNACRTTRL